MSSEGSPSQASSGKLHYTRRKRCTFASIGSKSARPRDPRASLDLRLRRVLCYALLRDGSDYRGVEGPECVSVFIFKAPGFGPLRG